MNFRVEKTVRFWITVILFRLPATGFGATPGCYVTFASLLPSETAVTREVDAQTAEFDRDFRATSARAIAKAFPLYEKADKEGHPHVRWLKEVGFRFSGNPNEVFVPSIDTIVRQMEDRVEGLITRGEIRPDQAVRPARVFVTGEGEKKQFHVVPFGQTAPEGSVPAKGIIPFPFSLKMLADGFYVIGENDAVGPRGKDDVGTVALHDLAHHSAFLQNPGLMAAHRDAARKLVESGAFYRRVPDVRSFRFADEGTNALSQRERLNALAALIQNGRSPENRPLGAKALQGLRFTLFLENGFEIPKADAELLFNHWRRAGMIPADATSTFSNTRLTYDSVKRHLEGKRLTEEEAAAQLKEAAAAFRRINRPIGGMPRDVFQEEQRRREEPQGFGYYFTPAYLAAKAEDMLTDYRQGKVTKEQLIEATARLQVATIEAGRFTAEEWLRDITEWEVSPGSEVRRYFTETGVFPKDLYFAAHGGSLK